MPPRRSRTVDRSVERCRRSDSSDLRGRSCQNVAYGLFHVHATEQCGTSRRSSIRLDRDSHAGSGRLRRRTRPKIREHSSGIAPAPAAATIRDCRWPYAGVSSGNGGNQGTIVARCPDPGRPARPPRRDHRSRGAQDDHQRAESGANVFMADFEDSNSPTWRNNIEGQLNLRDAVRREISFRESGGQTVSAERHDRHACSSGRAAGTSIEKHMLVDGEPVSGVAVRFRPVLLPQRGGADRARHRPILLSAEDGEPSRSAAVERRLHVQRSSSSGFRTAPFGRPS